MTSAKEHDSTYLSEQDYLATELASEVRREFIDGQVHAMTDSGTNHNNIAENIFSRFSHHLEGTPYITFKADMKVRLGRNYVYPDVVVDCGKMPGNKYISTAPVIVVEVLSRATRKIDTTLKLQNYIKLQFLLEYVLIEPDFVSIQVLRQNNNWLPEYYFLGDSITFESIGLVMTVEDIYNRVDNSDINEFRQGK